MSVSIGRTGREDLPGLLDLLKGCGLPPDGVEEHLTTTLTARSDGRVVGSVVLEPYGASALLRSVAVSEHLRGNGLGRRLTGAALNLARGLGVSRVYLLTETADGFFPRFGFRTVERSEVPEDVRRSVEFVSACPETARAMVGDLTGP